jgi:hypothetical protein
VSDEVELTRVSPAVAEGALGYAWDGPKAGFQPHPYSLDFSGWVLRESPSVQKIEVLHGDHVVRTTDVCLRHPAHPGLRPGYHASVSLISLPCEFELRVEGVCEDGSRVQLGSVEGKRQLLRSGYQAQVNPIVINHLARSGSTWFMHLLGEHPQIVTQRRYPSESCMGTHTMRMLEVLTTPCNPPQQPDLEKMRSAPDEVSPLPLFCPQDAPQMQAWLRREYVERFADFSLQMIDAFHQASGVSQRKTSVKYYAEKLYTMKHMASLFAEVCPGMKHLFLVRDFRDAVCSRQSFHRAKGKGMDVTLEQQIHWMHKKTRSLVENWKARGAEAHLVRYEDLMTQPVKTLQDLLQYLGMESREAMVKTWLTNAEATSPDMKRHQTSGGQQSSIGRWHLEMNAEQQALCNELLGEALETFGYASH